MILTIFEDYHVKNAVILIIFRDHPQENAVILTISRDRHMNNAVILIVSEHHHWKKTQWYTGILSIVKVHLWKHLVILIVSSDDHC